MAEIFPVGLAPREAVSYFARKGYQFGFDWRDVMRAEHAKAFTVAKMMRADLLADVRTALEAAIANGTTLEQFQQDLTPLLQRKGWWGRQFVTDPVTGETREVQLGSPRRLAAIYDANLRTSYAAGHWERIQRTKARRPYLRYVHLDNAHPRPQHAAWHGLVLPIDDPFWDAHFPPNGRGCHCSVQQLNDRDLTRYGYEVGVAPPADLVPWQNTRTGQTEMVPAGIDPGFDYNPGKAGAAHLDRLLAQRVAAAPADLREALES